MGRKDDEIARGGPSPCFPPNSSFSFNSILIHFYLFWNSHICWDRLRGQDEFLRDNVLKYIYILKLFFFVFLFRLSSDFHQTFSFFFFSFYNIRFGIFGILKNANKFKFFHTKMSFFMEFNLFDFYYHFRASPPPPKKKKNAV